MNRYLKTALIFATVLLFGLAFRQFAVNKSFSLFGEAPKEVPYSQFVENVETGKIVGKGTFRKDYFEGEYLKGAPGATVGNNRFIVALPPDSQGQSRAALQALLQEKGVKYEYAQTGVQDAIIGFIAPSLFVVAFLALFYFLMLRQAQSGGNQAMNFGRAKPRRPNENVPKVSFDDVAGVEEAKQDLQEIVDFLKNAKKYQALGAKIPKGVLLLGPPGSGKTLLARAIAGEAGVPFFHISGSDFVEMFVGVGASRVRDLFETARQNRPALVFIDEIDAVGRQRGAGWGGGHDEREQTLNQLLVEMDGFDPNSGVILVAATNRPDVLDPALLRPGRFDRRVVVDAPDQAGRKAILGIHLRGKPLADDVNVDSIARRTPGFSGAELANLVNEAALLAARKDKTRIDMTDFEAAVDRQMMGPERKSRIMSETVRRRTAVHEAGHAIVGELLANCDPVHKVTILPRGMALGVTISLPTEERYNRTKAEMEDRISMALAGRAAELNVYGDMDTGAVSDLERVTDIARAMVCEYGMSERLGPLRFGKRGGSQFLGGGGGGGSEERDYSEEVAQIIDEEVRGIIERNYNRAVEVLEANRVILLRVTEGVMEQETLGRDEFLALLQEAVVPTIGGRTPQKPNEPEPPNTQTIAPSESESEGVVSPTGVPDLGKPGGRRLEPGIA